VKGKNQNKPKRQHWVPRCYLRHFATPESKDNKEPLVWIFSKDEGDPLLTGVTQVAAMNYLYSPKRRDGTRLWDMEEKLASLEGVVAPLWPLLADGFIDLHKEKMIQKAVALFVAILHLRHPRMLREIAKIHAQLVEVFDSFPKDEHGNPLVAEVEHKGVRRRLDTSNWHQYKDAGHSDKHQMFVDSISPNAIHCAEILMKKRWSVVFSEGPAFITTDTPVAISNHTRNVFGLDTSGTIVSFPLSPTRVLLMDDEHDQPAGQYYPLAAHGPAPFNFVAWNNCERFMISSRPTDIVCTEMLACADSNGC